MSEPFSKRLNIGEGDYFIVFLPGHRLRQRALWLLCHIKDNAPKVIKQSWKDDEETNLFACRSIEELNSHVETKLHVADGNIIPGMHSFIKIDSLSQLMTCVL